MNWLKLCWKNIWHKPLTTGLSILLMALGVALVGFLANIGQQLDKQFRKNLENIDMVLGAKGSPVQIILSSVYHIGPSTGNISYAEAQQFCRNPLVANAIPLAIGDNYKGTRIVGTTKEYLDFYEAKLAKGAMFSDHQEVVIGAKVARQLGLSIGGTFVGTHGLVQTEEQHHEHPYKVVGILASSGTVLDQLIICNLETVWHTHHSHEGPKEISFMLVEFRSPMGMMQLPRLANQQTNMQAALPSIEISSLLDNLGIGISTLWVIGLVVIIVSGLSVFVSLLNALKERKYELALLRSLGAGRGALLVIPFIEALYITFLGAVAGLLLNKIGSFLAQNAISNQFGYELQTLQFTLQDLAIICLALGIGFLSAIIPALQALRLNIARTLAND